MDYLAVMAHHMISIINTKETASSLLAFIIDTAWLNCYQQDMEGTK